MGEEKLFSAVELSNMYNLKYDLISRNLKNKKIKSVINEGAAARNGEPKYLIKLSDFLRWLDYYYFSKGIENENK